MEVRVDGEDEIRMRHLRNTYMYWMYVYDKENIEETCHRGC